ncbi:MAG: protein kinase domain-containing protein [Pirellulaceae bacterium]
MSKTSIDRNILFGIVAVQRGLIAVEQLQAGFRKWIADKTTPVSEILKSQGALSEDQCRELDTLVDQELESQTENGDDLPMEFDESLTCTLQIFASDTAFQDFFESDSVRPSATGMIDDSVGAPTSAGRFHILKQHARGGLGEVFVARDAELDREVALKQLNARGADHPELQARFLREAEITGKLEHPGIVPVYGMGRDHDGRPFYAMRFIRGKSLRDAIREYYDDENGKPRGKQSPELRKMLGWLVDVCQAIAYAHSRGVLHRDLKPDNVMLGRYGETLVVDWGLARTDDRDETDFELHDESPLQTQLGPDSMPTVAGTAMGTPGYMSPEQARGQLDELGPPSDVYSLGATLYAILTGRPPLGGSKDVAEMLNRVIDGRIEPPSTINPDVPRPLESICQKAMSVNSVDRYQSPLDMAADIEAWLADTPVSAWSEPWSVRAGRWMKNNKALVAGMGATLLVALISSLVASTFLSSKNHDLVEAREIAEDQARFATEQGELALNTMNDVIREFQAVFELREAPDQMTPEMIEARRNMIIKALVALRKISESLKAHRDYSDALVIAHMDLGDIYLMIGGEDFEDARDDALREFEQALDICERWLEAEPVSTHAQNRFDQVLQRLSQHAYSTDNLDDACRLVDLSIQSSEKQVQLLPEGQSAHLTLFHNYFLMGGIEIRRFQIEQIVESYQKALALVNDCKSRGFDFCEDAENNFFVPESENRIVIFSNIRAARDDIEHAFTIRKDLIPRLIYDVAAWQAVDGEHKAAFQTLQRMDGMELEGMHYYNNACGYARCARALLNGRELQELSAEEQQLAEQYSALSVETLRNAAEFGYFDEVSSVGLLGRDPDMDVLRDREDFQVFAAEIQSSASGEDAGH